MTADIDMSSHIERDRGKIPERYKWNLTDIYPSDIAWETARDRLVGEIPALAPYRGTLKDSPARMAELLERMERLMKEYAQLASYASLSYDQDTRDSKYESKNQVMNRIATDLSAAMSFLEPEILCLPPGSIESYLRTDQRLHRFRHYLDDIVRRRAHTGTEGEESIIAHAGLMADAPDAIYGTLVSADFPYPVMKTSRGEDLRLDQAAFSVARTFPDREDRKKAFELFFGRMNEFRRTFGAQLSAAVKSHQFYQRARRYSSCLEGALDASRIPTDVYHTLIASVHDHLATFRRYLGLRRRILGVDQLHYYDLYAPLLKEATLTYSADEANALVLDALAPLGEDYVATVRRAFQERWIDYYPNEGKRSGGYSNGAAYEVHPYILMNYNGQYNDVTTLAHELGHTMHSFFSNKTQPYITAHYPIFVAEVASTLNEALLIDRVLKTVQDPGIRLSLLGSYLENIKGTIFRQTQFAEFELQIHERAERGEALTGDDLNEQYSILTKQYYGHEQGVCTVDDMISVEWAFIPHFYYNFYVYQYATSYTASAYLSERILAGDRDAVLRYREFLCSGGSDYPIELLLRAGVDVRSPAPMRETMARMNRVMDEMENLLGDIKR